MTMDLTGGPLMDYSSTMKKGGSGMDPTMGASLINLGGGILDSIFSPSVKKQLEWQRESEQEMGKWRANQITGALKPKTPYYQSGNLPQLGSAAYNAVMGNLMQRLGPGMLSKWGIDAAPKVAPVAKPVPANPQPFIGADALRQRYGV